MTNKKESGASLTADAGVSVSAAPGLSHAEMIDRLRLLARVHAANGGLTKMDTPNMRFTDRELAQALYAAVYRLEAEGRQS